ncbi:MAG: hypothetical protein ACRC24_03695 [Vibrionaceae bacterium]
MLGWKTFGWNGVLGWKTVLALGCASVVLGCAPVVGTKLVAGW